MFDKIECKQAALAESSIAFFALKQTILTHEKEKTLSDNKIRTVIHEFVKLCTDLIKMTLPLKDTSYENYFLYVGWKNILMELWKLREEKYPNYENTGQRTLTVID